VNSTPLGEVLNERQLHRHRVRAGLRIGDARHVDLVRYVAWLVQLRHTPRPEPESDPYEVLKERARARNIALSLAGRDIGDLPEVVNPERKERAAADFRFFCEQYFPLTFHLPWSPDHLRVIAKIEQAVLRGGLFAMAMPRGSGKTTLCECAGIWVVLYGHREFVCLIGSDEGHAMDMLDSIKMELDGNDLLLEDFPEVVYPIQCLDGIANRCAGQLYQGQRTHIGWTAREIVLPTIPGSKASGAIIKVAGITGRIRGMKYKRADGQTVRPTLVVIDDPQTDESARSLSQCATRESILAGAVLGLAGPGKKISGIMPCTVIRPGDMADNILSRDKHPEWNGERTKMVYAFPTHEKLWQRYAEIRAESFRRGGHGEEATEFYRQHRAEMDAGAVVAWPERFNPDELSAIQHAMNLKLQDEAAFFAEYQNEPLPEETVEPDELTADQIASKLNRMQRGEVPIGCNHVTMFIDVQAHLLFFVVCAWEEDFTGYVLDYGTYPDQKRPYFTLRDARPTLAAVTKAGGLEGAIYAGLEALTQDYLGREWRRDDGAIVEDVAGEVILPGGHNVEEQAGLHVDEHRDVVAADRHLAALHAVELARDLVCGELVRLGGFLWQRLVLVLGEERRLVLKLQVHRVLDRGEFVMVEPLRPGNNGSLIHRFPVGAVELGGFIARVAQTQALRANFGVPLPELLIGGERVDHPGPLAVPLRVLVAVQDVVGHVAGADDRAGHDARDLVARTGQAEDGAGQDALARGTLRERPRRLIGLRVVKHHQRRPHGLAVGPLVLHAANAARDAGDLDDRPARLATGYGGQDDLAGRPADVGALALVELPGTAVGDAVEALDRVDDLGEILEQEVVAIEFHLDRIEHVHRVAFIRSDQADELAVTIEHGPDAGAFADRALARAARHRHRKQAAPQHRLLDPADDFQVIAGPGEVEREREVAVAEEPEVGRGPLLSLWVDDRRQLADVAPRQRQRNVAGASTLLQRLVGIAFLFGPRGVADLHEPGDVTHQVHVPSVADAQPSPRAMAVELPLADHLAQRGRVEQAAQLARPQASRVSRHVPSPSPARRRSGPG
jgi:hypothetical protein